MGFFKKVPDRPPEGTSVRDEIKRAKMFGWRDVIICLLIVGFFLLTKNSLGLGSYGGLAPQLEETRFGITGLDGSTHYFTYVDADSIELHDDLKSFDTGEKVEGQENRATLSGIYRNDAFGEYQLHIQKKLNYYIVVRNADGVLVFNLESDDTTKELHRYIMELRDQQLGNTAE